MLKWIKHHLNWTFIIAMLVGFAIAILFLAINPRLLIYWMICQGILGLVLALWIIRQKNRSLWWILLVLYFWPTLLILKNYNQKRPSDNS